MVPSGPPIGGIIGLIPEGHQRWLSIGAFIVLLLAGATLRFWQLGALSLWGDEGLQAEAVRSILNRGFPQLFGHLYWRGIPELYAEALSVDIAGLSEFSLRLPSALAGLATVVATYCLGASIVSKRVGFVAAFLVAFSTWEIEISRYARMYSMFQLFFTLSTWWLFEVLFRGRHKFLIPALFAVLLTILSHRLGLLAIVPVGLALLWPDTIPTTRGRILVVCVGIGVVWLIYYEVLSQILITTLLFDSSLTVSTVFKKSIFFAPPLTIVKELSSSWSAIFYSLLGIGVALIVWLWVPVRRGLPSWEGTTLLSAMVVLSLFHQFGLMLATLLIYIVFVPRKTLALEKNHRNVVLMASMVICLAWVAYGLLLSSWSIFVHDWGESIFLTATNMINYPRVYDQFLKFFAWHWPFVTLSAATTGAWALYQWIHKRNNGPLMYLILVVATCTLLMGISRSYYQSARYSYHLYPVLLILTAVFIEATASKISQLISSRPRISRLQRTRAVLTQLAHVAVVLALAVGLNTDVNLAEAKGIMMRQYGNAILQPLKAPSSSYTFRQDLKTPVLFVKEHRRSGDKVISMTPSKHRFYIGTVDYMLRENPEPTIGNRSSSWFIGSIEGFNNLVRTNPGRRFWLIGDPIFLNDRSQFSDRFRCFMQVLNPQIVYTGLDDRSHVYLVSSSNLPKFNESMCEG